MAIFKNKLLRWILWPLSLVYCGAMRLRNLAYDASWLRVHRVDAVVISIGNLSVGGTGKTPAVIALAQALQQQGWRVGVLSRGYGRRGEGARVVSHGNGAEVSPQEAGDEPWLIAAKCTGAAVLVDADRVRGAQMLVEKLGVQVILLDDGFQHRRLHRDIDIVIFDPRQFAQNRFCLPAGPFREGVTAVRRAHRVWVVERDGDPAPAEKRAGVRVLELAQRCGCGLRFVPTALREARSGRALDLDEAQKKTWLAVSAIGQPEKFAESLQRLGLELARHLRFRDHHNYSLRDARMISFECETERADAVVTTEKDWVKLEPIADRIQRPIYLLEIRVQLPPEEPAAMVQTVRSLLKERHRQQSVQKQNC